MLRRVQLFATLWTAACQVSPSFTNFWSLLKLMSTELVMPSNHLILCHPLFLLPSIFLNRRAFPMSWPFASGGQSIGASASASVLPMNIQSRFLVGLTGLVSLTLESLSSTTVKKHQFSAAQFLCDPTLTSTHDFWKIHGFDYIALCQQGDISAF